MKKLNVVLATLLLTSCKTSPPRKPVDHTQLALPSKALVLPFKDATKSIKLQLITSQDFGFTNITDLGSSVQLQWQNSTNPVMVQVSTIVPFSWNNVGNSSVALQKTVLKDASQKFFRLQNNWPTVALHTNNNPHRLTIESIDVMPADYIELLKLKQIITNDGAFPSGGDWVAAQYSQQKGSVNQVLPESEYYFDDLTQPDPGKTLHYFATAHTHAGKTIELNKVFMSRQPLSGWSKTFTGASEFNTVVGVVVDGQDNIIVLGSFRDTIVLQGGPILTSHGSQDLFLIKYSSTGQFMWAKNYGALTGELSPKRLAVDSSGNIAVVGAFYRTTNLGGSSFTSHGDSDFFVVKYDSSGNHVWSWAVGGNEGGSSDYGSGVAFDSLGNVYASGIIQTIFTQTRDFGGLNKTFFFSSWNPFLVKYTAAGNNGLASAVWIANIFAGGGSASQAPGIAIKNNSIYFYGASDNVILGGDEFGTGGTQISQRGYLSVWDLNANLLIARQIGTDTSTKPLRMFPDSLGNIVVCGTFQLQTDLGGGVITSINRPTGWVAKYVESNLNYIWANKIQSTFTIETLNVAINSVNSILAAGAMGETTDFYVGNTVVDTKISAGVTSSDMFTAKYFTDGNLVVPVTQYGDGTGNDIPYDTAVDSLGSQIVCGIFKLSGSRCFLMKLAP